MYFPFVYHPGMKTLNQNNFFKFLRNNNIYFDF